MKNGLALGGALMTLVSGIEASAQEARQNAAPLSQGLEEIVVTSRRTSEALQTTPVAVSALNSAALERAQVQSVEDLQGRAPSLSIAIGGTSSPTQAQVSIRGQAQNSPGTNSDPAVGIYVDGVYHARPIASNVDVLDVGRLEILRGPQGTLFGRNTTGGALSITTNQPTGIFEGSVRLGVGNYDQRLFEAVVNVPLRGDELAWRGVFRYQEHDGYGRFERVNNRPAGDILGDYYTRGTLRWSPSSLPLTLAISGDYSNYKDSGQQQTLYGFNEGYALAPGFTLGNALALFGIDPRTYLTTNENFRTYFGYANTGKADLDTPFDTSEAGGASANLKVDLDNIEINSITAFRQSLTRNMGDISGLPVNLVAYNGRFAQHQFSQETNVSVHADRLDVIGGIYYFIENGHETNESQSFGFLNPGGPVAQVVGRGTDADVRNSSIALYAQANYRLNDRLRITGGFRYTWDKREVVLHSLADRSNPASCRVVTEVPGGPCNQTRKRSFDYAAWTAGLDFEASDTVFVYAKTSGASMAGGWNIRDSISPAFEPESVRDVEAGFKADLLDRKLRANVAIFYAWQSKVQRIVNAFNASTQSLTQYIQNAGSARTYGVEFEATALPWRGMELTGSLSLLRANYKTFFATQLVGGSPVTVDRSDEKFPQAPRSTFSLGATQTFNTQLGDLAVHADYAFVSDRVFYQDTASPLQPASVQTAYARANELGIIPGYGLVNGRITMNFDDPGIELALWARNIGGKRYLNMLSNFYTAFGPVIGYPGIPSTYGATATFKW